MLFSFTDIHGMYGLYKAIMDYCMAQDPDCMIVFCGDACDRGPDGYKIMKELLANPHVIYLKGNHEDLFVKAAYELKKYFKLRTHDAARIREELNRVFTFDRGYENVRQSILNGGLSTLTDWVAAGMPRRFVRKIEQLPYVFSYENIDFCHAAGAYPTFERIMNGTANERDYIDILWNRTGYPYGWAPGRTVIFGHTPVQLLARELGIRNPTGEPIKYVGTWDEKWSGEKIDMDTGAAFTGIAYVLDVEKMQAQGFKYNDNQINKIELIQF